VKCLPPGPDCPARAFFHHLKGDFTLTQINPQLTGWTYAYAPWHRDDAGEQTEIPAFEVFDANGDKIFDTNENRPSEEQEAQAALAAAAPDLLAALEMQQMAEYDREASLRKGYFDEAKCMRDAAIAKAKGGAA
jgi:hypothetical protein